MVLTKTNVNNQVTKKSSINYTLFDYIRVILLNKVEEFLLTSE